MITLLFCIFTQLWSQAQNKTIDNLLQGINQSISAQQKIDYYNELAWEFRSYDTSKSLKYANKAKRWSDSLKYKEGYHTSLNRIGVLLISERKFKEALDLYEKILILEEKKKDTFGIARAKNQLGIISRHLGDYDKAIRYGDESINYFEILGRQKSVASVANNLGATYTALAEYDNAQEAYSKGLKIREILKDTSGIAKSHLNLGSFYEQLDNDELALYHLSKSESLFIYLKNDLQLSKVYISLGVIYEKKNQLEKALDYYQKSLNLKQKIEASENQDVLYNNLGIVYEKQNNLPKALDYYRKSLTIKFENGLNIGADVYNNIANLLQRKEAYQEALVYYHKSLTEAQKTNDRTLQLKVLDNMAKVYATLRQYDKSFKYNNAYNTLRDSIDKAYKNALEIRVLYDKEKKKAELLKKDNEVAQANLEKSDANNKQQRTLIIALLGGIFLLSLIYYFSKRVSKQKANIDDLIKDQEIKSINTMISTQDSERKRIAKELHDNLGSKLSVVKIHFKTIEEHFEQLQTEEVDNYQMANNLLDDACEEIRKIAYDMSSGILSNFGLSQAVQDLVNSIETASQIDIEYVDHNLEDRLDSKIELHIYRIVQELVSNILRHAKATEMTLQILRNKEGIHIMTIDDGVGFNSKRVTKGMGLQNIQTRVEELEGDLKIDSRKGNGTTISIQIPIDE